MKTYVVTVRHPDYENEHHVIEGDDVGVEIIDIDTGREFSNGNPTRFWAAERYFDIEAPAVVKRAVLDRLKGLTDRAEKLPRGEDPGSW